MKNLLLIVALGVLGYYAYQEWFAKPAPAPAAAAKQQDPSVVSAGNDFFIYTRVKTMYREWKERSVGTPKRQQPGARNEDLSILLTEIRIRLAEPPYKIHTPETVEEVMLVSLARPDRDLDVPSSQRRHVLSAIMTEATNDGIKTSHHSPREDGGN